MSYIVVQQFDTKTQGCFCVLVDEITYSVECVVGVVALEALGSLTIQKGLKPLNFSVDRYGVVKMDCGDFSRFGDFNGAVVLAEIKTRGGRTLGYRLLSCNSSLVTNVRTEEIVSLSRRRESPFLQNGIIRNNTVNCFKLKPFPVLVAGNKAKVEVHADKDKKVEPKGNINRNIYTSEQKVELNRCRNMRVPTSIIENPELSPKQMRVLWVSKNKGAYSEAFANPALSLDVMKFYADRLVTPKIVEDCGLLLSHPELSLDTLSELYLCICEGIEYEDLIGLDAEQIMVERKKRSNLMWTSFDSSKFGDDYFDKAVAVAMKMRGL